MTRPTSLCQLLGTYRSSLPSGGMMGEEKRDGWRALWIDQALHTRQGLSLHAGDHLAPVLRLMETVAGQQLFIDAEYQVGNSLAATKHHCETGWKSGERKGALWLFDCLPLSEWRADNSQRPLHERKAWLADLVERAKAHPLSWELEPRDLDAVRLIDDTWIFDAGHAMQEASRIWSGGGEGLVLKQADALYRRNRNDTWLKLKTRSR